MSATKTPKALLLIAILALMGALVAGCGGSGGTTSADQNPPKNPPSQAVEPKVEPGSEEEAAEEQGSSESTGEEEGASEGMSEEEGASEGEAGKSEEAEGGSEAAGGSAAEGMTVFTTNCGSCHTLKAAGTSGNIGPNLDELMPSESTVEMQVINGGGPMPAFGNEGILKEAEIKAVAAYVSSEAGK